MTAPTTTPLILPSELTEVTADLTVDATITRFLTLIGQCSALVTRYCDRRFDERIETRYYTARSLENGGDVDGHALRLDDDLRSLITLTNGDGLIITTDYQLLPRATSRRAVANKTAIWLDVSSGVYWAAAPNDPTNAIQVAGTWGYGGQWLAVTTLNGGVSDSAMSWTAASGAACEAGMVLKADSEYVYLSAVSTNTLTVSRAFNGSTAAAHLTGATLYRWQADEIAAAAVKRLVLWRLEQNKSPLAGQVVLGDLAYPVRVDAMPADVASMLADAGLVRVRMPMGV